MAPLAGGLAFLAEQLREREEKLLDREAPVEQVQVDDLITLEHAKCKPLNVCVVVDSQHRLIQGFGVARIPASGSLAAISRKKYGKRRDESCKMRDELFAEVQVQHKSKSPRRCCTISGSNWRLTTG